MKKFPLVLAVLAMLVVPLAAQGQNVEKPLTYSVFFHTDELFEWWNNDKDIVTPYFEKKFVTIQVHSQRRTNAME